MTTSRQYCERKRGKERGGGREGGREGGKEGGGGRERGGNEGGRGEALLFSFLLCSSAVEEGKGIYFNIRNFVRFQLST